MMHITTISTPLSNRSKTTKKRVARSTVDTLDDIRLQAMGLRSRIDALVAESERQIKNHQRKVAWCKTDLIKAYEDLVEAVENLGVPVDNLRD